MTATEFWPLLAPPLLNGIALLLALGFRRNRAVIVLAVLTFSSLALAGVVAPEQGERGTDAARMFAPWLLLAAAAMPERRLLARRNLVLLLLLAIAIWLTLAAPAHVWPRLRSALPLGLLPWSIGAVAASLTFLAAALCLLRWVLHGAPMEAGLCIVLALVGLALLPVLRLDAVRYAFALAGAGALSTILYASYRMAFVDALAGLPTGARSMKRWRDSPATMRWRWSMSTTSSSSMTHTATMPAIVCCNRSRSNCAARVVPARFVWWRGILPAVHRSTHADGKAGLRRCARTHRTDARSRAFGTVEAAPRPGTQTQ